MDPLSPSNSGIPPLSSQDAIAHRAREIWHARGKPEGQDVEIWLEAERELQLPTQPLRGTATGAVPPATTRKPEPGEAVEPGPEGLRKTKRGKRTLQEKLEDSLPRGGYGEGGPNHVGPSA